MAERTCCIPECDSPTLARRMCNRHYKRWRKYNDTSPPRPFEERLWSQVDRTDDCWSWTGCTDGRGYGVIRRNGRQERVHRAVLVLAGTAIPEGMAVDHKCHNTLCVRPDHLQVVTPRQNSENRRGAQRRSATGVRGVAWRADMSKYEVRVYSQGKSHRRFFANLADAERGAIELRNELMQNNLRDRSAV